MNNFYNYIYLDPTKQGVFKYPNVDIIFDYEPFYIGKGSSNRLLICTHTNSTNKLLTNKLKKLKNNVIILKIFDNIPELEALNNEISYIKNIGRRIDKSGPLANLTEGGEGISGYKHTKEAIIKITNSSKDRIVSD